MAHAFGSPTRRKKALMGEEAYRTAQHVARLNAEASAQAESDFEEQLRRAAEESMRSHVREVELRAMAGAQVSEEDQRLSALHGSGSSSSAAAAAAR